MRLLHLVGATNTRFYHDLSLTYHSGTVVPEGMTTTILRVDPTGDLFLKDGPDTERPTDLSKIAEIAKAIDLVVPFMFCPDGMIIWRELFEGLLGVPVVGPPVSATVISTSKWQTKAIAAAANVATPAALRLRGSDTPPVWSGPCIVKPDSEDNSLGLSLVMEEDALPQAIAEARRYASDVLVEDYIPGREMRVGVIDTDGSPRVLPVLEYHVSDAHPIRMSHDKVDVDTTGKVTKKSWDYPTLQTSCPADLSDPLQTEIAQIALTMHRDLGARDYSLYDLRVHAETGRPTLLEACSFWTFAPFSIISRMLTAEGNDLEKIAAQVFHNAASRDTRKRDLQRSENAA